MLFAHRMSIRAELSAPGRHARIARTWTDSRLLKKTKGKGERERERVRGEEKEKTGRSLRKELLVIYSMVVLEAFATMGSPIVVVAFNGLARARAHVLG